MNTLTSISDYPKLLHSLRQLSEGERWGHLRNLARTDLYFLLRYLLNRPDIEHPWLFARCREVQQSPNGYLDLWSREHYKSTIITFALSIQDILRSHGEDPLEPREVTLGIFSFNRGKALDFVVQIMRELENNKTLQHLFPDILYEQPQKHAPSWSQMGGLVVKRKTNPREATIEGWGLVDSMPTGAHFVGRVYDDVISEKFARSEEMVAKATESWELSLNLGSRGGFDRYIGTRYAFHDTYKTIIERGSAIPRIYTATTDGNIESPPVLLTPEELARKRRDMGPYIFSSQMMQNPLADEIQGFVRDWVQFYDRTFDTYGMNVYIIVDPANEKHKKSDYTAMAVIGLASDQNYYLLDAVRDRLNLTQRTAALMHLHKKWQPIGVGYEKYGVQADIEHIKTEQARVNHRFDITPLGGNMAKNDRIRKLIPVYEQHRFYLPHSLHYTMHDGRTVDIIEEFLAKEYSQFPFGEHDDLFDASARILDEDLGAVFPFAPERATRYTGRSRTKSWMTR